MRRFILESISHVARQALSGSRQGLCCLPHKQLAEVLLPGKLLSQFRRGRVPQEVLERNTWYEQRIIYVKQFRCLPPDRRVNTATQRLYGGNSSCQRMGQAFLTTRQEKLAPGGELLLRGQNQQPRPALSEKEALLA